jgi:hypothetical protein
MELAMDIRLAAMTAVLVAAMLAPAPASDRIVAYAVLRVQSLPAQIMFVRYSSIGDCRRELARLKLLAISEFRLSGYARRDIIAPDDLQGSTRAPERVEGDCRVLPKA